MLEYRLPADCYIRLQAYHKTINRHFQSTSGRRLRGDEDKSRYYDSDENPGLAECSQ